jgi:hypothetical protein
MPLAAPLILPFAELAGITIAGLSMAAASQKISDFISDNPELSKQILTTLLPGGVGLNTLFKKEAGITLEDVEEMTDEEAADLSKEDKAEIMKEVGKSKGGDKRQRMIEISEKLGLSGKGKEEQDFVDEVEERYEGTVREKKVPFDYKKFFRNRNADGGAIGIEVLFEEKKDGGRIGFANGGQNIIGADLKEKESVFFPKGDFENIRATSPTRKDYNIRSTEDLVRNVNPFGIVGEIGAPAAALAMSRPYDMIQAGARTTTSDIDRAIQSGALTPREIADEAFGLAYERENPLSTAIERTIGAAGPLAERVGDMFSGVGNFFFAPAGAADFQGGKMLQTRASPVRADYERAPNTAFAELLAQTSTPKSLNEFDNITNTGVNPRPTLGNRIKTGIETVGNKLGSVGDYIKGGGIIGQVLQNLGNMFEYRGGMGYVDEDGNFISAEELDKRNARGGYYTDVARASRRRAREIARYKARDAEIKGRYEKLLEDQKLEDTRRQAAFNAIMDQGNNQQDFYDSLNQGSGSTAVSGNPNTSGAGDAPGYAGPTTFAKGGIATMFVEKR